jgi:predicted ATP-dependent endonuclease of OLD family
VILRRISVEGFRSIRSSQDLQVDQFVTVLIGANDHGKTNLLAAMNALNDDFEIEASDCNWDVDEAQHADFPKLKWTFELTDAERQELVARAQSIRAKQEAEAAEIAADNAAAADEDDDEEEPVAPAKPATKSGAKTVAVADDDEDEDDEVEIQALVDDDTIKALEELKTIEFSRTGVGAEVVITVPDKLDPHDFVIEFLLKARPRVEMFKGTTKIIDSITLDELPKDENEFMQGIFRKAEIWEDRGSLFKINPRSKKRLDDASELLTERVREEWQQGKDLHFLLGHAGNEGNRIELSIKDPSVDKQYVLPTQRSTGFSAFFGMSMALFARKEASPANNYLFVFDEPGTALHPHGQVNVQRVFETLSRKNQITFTTHSIFMVNKNYPPRNRVVTKTEKGTLIDHKPYIGNWKAVRSNLGLIFANNFFVADTTLLVEGPSELIYVSSLLRTADHLGLIDVDLNLFSILDSGNAADMVAMAKITADEGRRVVALVDGDGQGAATKKKLDALNRTLAKEQTKIETIILPKNKSIEDVVVFPKLLKEAVVKAAVELVEGNIRKFKEKVEAGAIAATLDAELAAAKDVTLGKAIQDATKKWFDDDEPISKLHVARIYDDLVEAALEKEGVKVEFDKPPKDLAIDLHTKLALPQKTAQQTVTE